MLTLGRGLAAAITVLSLSGGDGLLVTENGRTLAAQNGQHLAVDASITTENLPLWAENGAALTCESGSGLVSEAPAAVALENVALENGDTLNAETGNALTLE